MVLIYVPRQSFSDREPGRRTDWTQAQNGTSRISLSEPKASLRVSARCMTLAITLRSISIRCFICEQHRPIVCYRLLFPAESNEDIPYSSPLSPSTMYSSCCYQRCACRYPPPSYLCCQYSTHRFPVFMYHYILLS